MPPGTDPYLGLVAPSIALGGVIGIPRKEGICSPLSEGMEKYSPPET